MFVSKSKYEQAVRYAEIMKIKYELEVFSHNMTKSLSSKKPGQDTSQFTSEEIKTLIGLCHPDKHNGSISANKMTTRLLALRNK